MLVHHCVHLMVNDQKTVGLTRDVTRFVGHFVTATWNFGNCLVGQKKAGSRGQKTLHVGV